MFEKILIANRGEIACRVIRTAKKLGIATVAVYSDADAQSQHVKLADEAIYIGESPAAQSYLQVDRIIQAAKSTGAQAIHPGYGFLSENDQFALACKDNNIVFIGPPVEAILAMGLKATSKALMEKAGVPLTPGYHGSNQDAAFLKQQADQIGYPVLIKASAGGGGKGMRLVERSEDFLSLLASCKSEARSSFGNEDVLIERYVIQPRHIEVQVFGDTHGNYVHLFERDCSVQRRHQKVLEEAPAPKMPENKLEAMRQAAIDAARAVDYVGAGTVEFIVEQDGTAYFMEMNTRLQVEHPVTEMITGQDLVEWQLRVAFGEPLPKQQHELQIHGHALEARVYAEEPEKGFIPAIGQISYLHYPEQNDAVRVDSGIVEGDEISTYYDPMIAKLIVWGKNREAALTQMHHALGQFHVDGLGNNIAFLDRLVLCDSFKNANLDTGLIQREEAFLLKPSAEINAELVISAALIELLTRQAQNPVANNSVWQQKSFWRLNQQNAHTVQLQRNSITLKVQFNTQDQGFVAHYNGQQFPVQGQFIDAHTLALQLNAKQQKLAFSQNENGITLFHNGQTHSFDYIKSDYQQQDEQGAENNLTAPMPGVITQVLVAANARVKKDDVLMTLEAMKIEYSIRAPFDGIVASSYFQAGDQVKAGDELVEFEALTEEVA
ncbi:acetyl/propionyl/methylcrotonyl-CoA carboxylase subunit alpha [Acinetobacter sp. C_4_1]|uniref:acetyl/propionyl/methylcrotonyl-CoA carboxylase subunit alpha n=1 Tax=unclassified Acinetobacter TaxID=196816 RepID=UPI0021B76857|nr:MULTISPECIES: acetyl/propionyl/methylcrotonyl-CoA carboxylase subunit alpha [unclassified Acinetobacter]MCT8089563.1 acetyl/propionyl/methylcrotonyl-CoA carboxylase subunit alpha [Acinetobacter sp. F_3_1]MCT8098282.1 acetyl/propionyl/methylcrotonyl-CoA carboxylase subunit alpha [Acinetobacter sp. C_3_1]MCT8101197.1 acetyl/propionyl/methylcrotonyl-CoA carboxylase subunit alpha [Acinetobacter sp. C_4_1]MCT8135185.1 acetyl/propionyl/methylcrotonyl-CoA carboxylase subunit alpha [Acinetobacter sp